ncbi:putative ribonuclease H-like domain-containing protein [Tanacetum coccineum]
MLSNSPLSLSSPSTDNKDADEVPGKGDDDLSERNGQEKEEGDSNKEDDQHVQDFRAKLDNLLVLRKEGYANNTNRVSTVNPYVSTAGQGFDNADDQERIDSSTQDVNTVGPTIGIFDDAYDDREELGAETDLNNLETTMDVSSIPTTRIHKDHPIEQIIRDLHLAPLTRRMLQQNIKKLEPKKVIQALTDPSWIEAMQEEHLQFKLQKVWNLVDLLKGKRATRTKIEAIRLFLAYASFMRLIVYQMDVKSAFLYSTIEEEVYVCQPPGFEDPQFPDKVYKVDKALYGLHQAPKAWHETLSTYLLENGYIRGTLDKTLFIKKDRGDILLVQMSSMGELTFFLGLQVQQKEDGIFISQDKYVADILKKFDFTTIKATSTPIETNKALNKDEEVKDVDVHLYRSMIGSLMYLTASRPDIMFVVCACVRVSPFDLEAFSDSDYAGASLDRKFTTGEYVAAANCYGQVLWIQNQMLDYGFNFMNTKIHIDNESTICIVKNPVFHSKTKHIKIRHHFIRDSYEKKLIQVIKIHTDHNVVDLLTKAFDVSRMERAATTASSLEAEQDSGNKNRIQSMAILNESFPQGTNSGSGPRCQDTILEGAEAQIRIGVDTARHKLNTASINYSTRRVQKLVTLPSPEVKTAAESLVYIRRSATKRKDKGKAIMKEAEPVFRRRQIATKARKTGLRRSSENARNNLIKRKSKIVIVHEEDYTFHVEKG